jgi:hypothetical protein
MYLMVPLPRITEALFQIGNLEITNATFEEPKRTNCATYTEQLTVIWVQHRVIYAPYKTLNWLLSGFNTPFSRPIIEIVRLGSFTRQGGFLGGIKCLGTLKPNKKDL